MSTARTPSENQQIQDLFSAIRAGQLNMVQSLADASLMSVQNEKGFTPIALAACLGHQEIVKYLLMRWIEPQKDNNKDDLFQLGRVVFYYLQDLGSKNLKPQAITELEQFIEKLFSFYAIDNYSNEKKENSLHLVMKLNEKYKKILELLLQHDQKHAIYKFNLKDEHGAVPLQYGVATQTISLVQTLCQHIDWIKDQFINHESARACQLFLMIKQQHFDMFKILMLPKYIDFSYMEGTEVYTVMSYAARFGEKQLLNYLIDMLERNEISNKEDQLKLGLAILLILQRCLAQPKDFSVQEIEKIIKTFFRFGAIDHSKFKEGGKTSLHIAANFPAEYENILKILFQHDQHNKINEKDAAGLVPSAYATKNNNAVLAKILIHYPRRLQKENMLIFLMNLSGSGLLPSSLWLKILSDLTQFNGCFRTDVLEKILLSGERHHRLLWRIDTIKTKYNQTTWFGTGASKKLLTAMDKCKENIQKTQQEVEANQKNSIQKNDERNQSINACIEEFKKEAQNFLNCQESVNSNLMVLSCKYGLFSTKIHHEEEGFVLISPSGSQTNDVIKNERLACAYQINF